MPLLSHLAHFPIESVGSCHDHKDRLRLVDAPPDVFPPLLIAKVLAGCSEGREGSVGLADSGDGPEHGDLPRHRLLEGLTGRYREGLEERPSFRKGRANREQVVIERA